MAEQLQMKNCTFGGMSGVVPIDNPDGLVDFSLAWAGENVVFSGEPTIQGNRGIKIKNDNGADMTVITLPGSDLEEKMSLASMQNAQFAGTFIDQKSSSMTKTYTMKGAVLKNAYSLSADTVEFIIRGNCKYVPVPN